MTKVVFLRLPDEVYRRVEELSKIDDIKVKGVATVVRELVMFALKVLEVKPELREILVGRLKKSELRKVSDKR